MKEIKYTCDRCKKPIDGTNSSSVAGGGELCNLMYYGKIGYNQVPNDGWHFHYVCFLGISEGISELLNSLGVNQPE